MRKPQKAGLRVRDNKGWNRFQQSCKRLFILEGCAKYLYIEVLAPTRHDAAGEIDTACISGQREIAGEAAQQPSEDSYGTHGPRFTAPCRLGNRLGGRI